MIDFSKNFIKAQLKYSIFIILTFFVLFSQVAHADSSEKAIRNHINHANTYFWFGMAEKGNMDAFRRGIKHLDEAEALLQSLKLPGKVADEIKRRIDALRIDFKYQIEVHFDTLYGVFPLVRLLAPSLFTDALAAGTFELVDDPAVMASTAAGYRLSKDVFQKWSSRPQLNLVINSVPANKALENEILFIFNSSTKFFVHNFREVTDILSSTQIEQFQTNKITHEIKNQLCEAFGIIDILIVTIYMADVVNNNHYYIIEGKIYNIHKSEPTHTFLNMGFSRDRNSQLWPIILSNAVLLMIALVTFVFLTRLRDTKWVSYPGVIVIPLTGFFIGRVIPWILIPILSSIAPVSETLAILSFWWPCLTGAVLFLMPAVLYRIVSERIRPFSNLFIMDGRGGAIFTSIALGVCAYLAGPVFLFLESNAIGILLPLVLCSTFVMYYLGRILDMEALSFHTIAMPVIVLLGVGAAVAHLINIYLWILSAVAIILLASMLIPVRRIKSKQIDKDSSLPLQELPVNSTELAKRSGNHHYRKFETFHEAFRIAGSLLEAKTCRLALTGLTGTGKTATAMAIVSDLRKKLKEDGQNLVLLKGECPKSDPHGNRETHPYAPFQKALTRYFKVNVLSPPVGQLKQIDAALDGIFESILPFSGLLFPSAKDISSPASSKDEVFISIARAIKKLAEKNTVILFIDDVHWIDNASGNLLSFLMDEFKPGDQTKLLILLTSRRNNGVLSSMNEHVLNVKMPDEEQRTEILVSCLGLSKEVAKSVIKKVGMGTIDKGGLFWLFRVVSHLAANRLFRKTEDGFKWSEKYKDVGSLSLPDDFYASIEEQLKKIGKFRPILECAACLGMEFSAEILTRSLGASRLEILQSLDRIEKKTGILFDVRESDNLYAFSSSFILEVLRSKLNITGQGPKDRKVPQLIREYHGKLADCLEKTLSLSTNKIYEVALHYYAAGAACAKKAIEYCLKSAHTARLEFLFSQARNFINMAAECGEVLGEHIDLEEEYLCIDFDEAHVQGLHRKETALAGLSYINKNPDASIDLLIAIARSCYDAGLDADDEKMFIEAVRLGELIIEKADSPADEAEGYHFVGISLSRNETNERKSNLQKALDLLEPLPENDIQSQTLRSRVANSLAELLSYGTQKNLPKAKSLFELSADIKKRPDIHDLPGLARSHGGLGRIAFYDEPADTVAARKHFMVDLELSDKIGDVTGQSKMHSFLGACDKIEGKNSEAIEHYKLSFEMAEATVDKFFAAAGLLESFFKDGQTDEFDSFCEDLLPLALKEGIPQQCASLYSNLFDVYGDIKESSCFAKLKMIVEKTV